jgi:hypothetical protein
MQKNPGRNYLVRGRGWGQMFENVRGWGGDGDGGCGDGEGTGTVGALRGGYGDQCLSPCHSLSRRP